MTASLKAREQVEIELAVQLELPEVCAPEISILYIEMDGTGVPTTAAETRGRKGKGGGAARTREVKLGCVFTQSGRDKRGRPLRDEDSTTYRGAIEDAAAFGRRIWSEAWRLGWSRARKKVTLGDGAVWIWNLAHQYFPGAIEIVDLFHAREHLWELASKLDPSDKRRRHGWVRRMCKKRDAGRIEQLVASLRAIETDDADVSASSGAGGGLLRAQCRADEVWRISATRFICRLGSDRGRLSHTDCISIKAIGYVLERARRQCHHRPTLLPPLQPLQRLLGNSHQSRLNVTILSHTPSSTVAVTVIEDGSLPIANADTAMVNEDSMVTIPVRSNDVNNEPGPLAIVTTTNPANGTIVVNLEGSITYTPNPDDSGPDSFTYTIVDADNLDSDETATGTVTVSVEKIVSLSIGKRLITAQLKAGESATYEVSVASNGPSDAVDIALSDTPPLGLTFVAAGSTAGCAAAGQVVTCDPFALADGDSMLFTINVAIASSATGVLVTDTFPTELTIVSWTCSPNGSGSVCTPMGNGDIVNASATIEAGDFVTFSATGTVTIPSNTTVMNTATLTVPTGFIDSDGAAYTVSGTVVANPPSMASVNEGTVDVSDGTGGTCMASVSAGAFSCMVTSTTPGAKTLSADFNVTANFNASMAATVSHTVNQGATLTTVTGSFPNPSIGAAAFAVTYSVVGSPMSPGPTGMVTVTLSGGGTCTGTVAAGTCMLTPTMTGMQTLTASYPGDLNYSASMSAAVGHNVSPPPMAANDAYTIYGNTSLEVNGTGTGTLGIPQVVLIGFLLPNDVGIGNMVTVSDTTSGDGGSVSVNNNGTAADPLTILNDNVDDTPDDDGQEASGLNDTIFVVEGDGTATNQALGIIMANGQPLIGEGVALTMEDDLSNNGKPVTATQTLLAAGTQPKITNPRASRSTAKTSVSRFRA